MAVNLLTLLQEQFTPAVIDQLATAQGQPSAATLRTAQATVPTVLAGLAHRIQTDTDARGLIDWMANAEQGPRTTPLDLAQVTATSAETRQAVAGGTGFIKRIFGDKTGNVAAELARHGGITSPAAETLLDLTGAVLLGLLGRQVSENGLTPVNLRTLLAGQAADYRAALPAGALASVIGPNDLPDADDPVQKVDSLSGTAVNPNIPKSTDIERQRENVRWLRPAMIALAALITFLIVQKCREPQNSVDGIMTDTTRGVESNAAEDRSATTTQNAIESGASPYDSTAPGALGIRRDVVLPGGTRLNVATGSLADSLSGFLGGEDRRVPRTFAFQDIEFESSSTRITGQTRPRLDELAKILNAYPNVAVRIEGHTDITGPVPVNEQLARERAAAIKNALVSAGVAAGRIETAGYGARQPEATNQTAPGRQRNRRIDVVITKV